MDCDSQRGKDPDNSDSRKTFIILVLTCSVVSWILIFFSLFLLPLLQLSVLLPL